MNLNSKLTYLSPWKPASHSHTGPSRLSIHFPLFLQGLSLQYGPNWHLNSKQIYMSNPNQNKLLLSPMLYCFSCEGFLICGALVKNTCCYRIPLSGVLPSALAVEIICTRYTGASIQAGVGGTRADANLTVCTPEGAGTLTEVACEIQRGVI